MSNLSDYVKLHKGAISEELCNKTISSLQNVRWELHTFYEAGSDIKFSHKNEPHSYYKKIDTTNDLMDSLKPAITGYVDGLNIPYWNAWTGFSYPKFNRYNVDAEMQNHCDHIHSLFPGEIKGIPVLTMIGQLNDGYSGGGLMVLEKEYKMDVGDVLIFPSCFLYPHRVQKVTSGVRYSLAAWSW